MNKGRRKYNEFFLCLLVAAVTILPFWQVSRHEFLNYDDPEYVTTNPYVSGGLTAKNIRWAFTSTVANHWHPLTWLSHMLDCQLFGLNPAAHHLMNLFLHVLNTILLFLILKRTTFALWQSAFVAILFAIHPLHVESVAWVAERKDVLSGCLWMLSLAAYSWYVRRGGTLRYLLTLVFFALGLMAKPMLVTLPFVLLLLDIWPFERICLRMPHFHAKQPRSSSERAGDKTSFLLYVFLEKIPFFVLSAASAAATILVMKRAGHVADVGQLTLKYRLANALVSYAAYILKLFCPTRLAPFYPHPGSALPVHTAAAAFAVLFFISVFVFYYARRAKYLLAGWFWYLITLLPVIGLLQVGSQARADRYTYIPLIGLFIIISFGAAELLQKSRHSRLASSGLLAGVTAVLIICTYLQVRHWRNSITLFEHSLAVTDKNYLAHNNLANALGSQGQYDAAIEHCLKALQIRPQYHIAHYNLGMAFFHKGDVESAVEHWTKLSKENPRHPDIHYNLAVAFLSQNKLAQAVEHLRRQLELDPTHAKARKALRSLEAGKQPLGQ